METQISLTVENRRQALIAGYARINKTDNISFDVVAIISSFHDETISLEVNEELLKRCKLKQNIFLPFSYQELQFRFGWYPKRRGYRFSPQLQMNDGISDVVALFLIYDSASKECKKRTLHFKGSNSQHTKLIIGDERSPDDKDTLWCECKSTCAAQSLIWHIPDNISNMTIYAWWQILSIQYKDIHKLDYHLSNIKLKRKITQKFKFKTNQLKMENGYNASKRVYLPIFPVEEGYFNWIFSFSVPSSWSSGHTRKEHVHVDMSLLRKPEKISFIYVDWKMILQYGNKSIERSSSSNLTFGLDWWQSAWQSRDEEGISGKELMDLEEIVWKIEIEIKKVEASFDDEIIDSALWDDYGVTD